MPVETSGVVLCYGIRPLAGYLAAISALLVGDAALLIAAPSPRRRVHATHDTRDGRWLFVHRGPFSMNHDFPKKYRCGMRQQI